MGKVEFNTAGNVPVVEDICSGVHKIFSMLNKAKMPYAAERLRKKYLLQDVASAPKVDHENKSKEKFCGHVIE